VPRLINNRRITITDVAKKAGVSKQTVSRVINDRPDVAEETRGRIKTVIKQLGYRPDPIARSMKGITHTFGCITPNLSDFNFSSIVQYAQAEARQAGFFLLTGSANSENDVPALLNEIVNRRVDGLMVLNPRDDKRYSYLLPLVEKNTPVVYIKNTPVDEPVSAVCLDDEMGGYLATDYLLKLGHTRIATILGPRNEQCTQERLIGFQKAYQEADTDYNQATLLQGNWSAASGSSAIKQLLKDKTSFSAVFAQNDNMAVGAIRALRESGLRIPQDVSIIGYDDIPLSSFFDPPLTTIRQPIEQFGRLGAKLLIAAVKDQDFKPQIIRLDPELIIRETCLPYQN